MAGDTPPSDRGPSAERRPSEESIEAALRAGAALYTIGEYHAAHDPWETVWLRLDGEDEQLFHGLIQLAAAVYHARRDNPSGASGLAESAAEYLSLGETARGVRLPSLRSFCRTLADDPGVVNRNESDGSDAPWRDPPPLRIDGRVVRPSGLSPTAVPRAARAIAEEYDRDVSAVDDAARFARDDAARVTRENRAHTRREHRPGTAGRSGTTGSDSDEATVTTDDDETNGRTGDEASDRPESTFTRMLRALVVETDRRGVVFQRLAAKVDRRRREDADVRDLFE